MFFQVDNPANPRTVEVVAPQELQSICEDFLQKNHIPYQVQECDKEKCVAFQVRERLDACMLQFVIDLEREHPTDNTAITAFHDAKFEIEWFLYPLFDYEHTSNYNALSEYFSDYLRRLPHSTGDT